MPLRGGENYAGFRIIRLLGWGMGEVYLVEHPRLPRHLGEDDADTYADLFDDDLDAAAASLHSRYSPEKCVHGG